ncbi:MAG TPA: alpha-isopropylmalate synthase regulatory domain-containing protein [Candidatus Limnocylindrales bacterium]
MGSGDMGATSGTGDRGDRLRLTRWNVTSGSNTQSRAAVVIQAGDHQWDGRAESPGPIAALYRAVDAALAGVLSGHPRLLSYDVHAVSESPDSEGVVTVTVAPPESAAGERAEGRFDGEARSENIIAASVEAYVQAIDRLLGHETWAGATEAGGNRRVAKTKEAAARRQARGVTLDEEAAERTNVNWFER